MTGMGELTAYFSIREFACRHGPPTDLDALRVLCVQLEALRAHIGGRPLIILPLGGYRCPECNRLVGGAMHSQHLLCRAADIRPPRDYDVDALADAIEFLIRQGLMRDGGLGRYYRGRPEQGGGFVHYDVRVGGRARWRQRR